MDPMLLKCSWPLTDQKVQAQADLAGVEKKRYTDYLCHDLL